MLKEKLKNNIKQGNKLFALLIDPDKHTDSSLSSLFATVESVDGIGVVLVGGSIVFNGVEKSVSKIKQLTKKPVYLFPGNAMQVSERADGILLLSLISGRNPDFLIGNHVLSAPKIKSTGLDVLSVGYILVDSGVSTSVSYMSNTFPIPYEKNDIAVATAMAGELLGLQSIYLEAGSGAVKPVADSMIRAVKQSVDIPVIVGGGIKSTLQLKQVLDAGADMVVVGTVFENNTSLLKEFAEVFKDYSQDL